MQKEIRCVEKYWKTMWKTLFPLSTNTNTLNDTFLLLPSKVFFTFGGFIFFMIN